MREYAFFTNFPTPQKVVLFNHLNERLKGRIVFFFYSRSVPKREGWEKSLEGADFRYEILESRRMKTSPTFAADEGYFFLIPSLPNLKPFRKIVISGGLTPSELLLSMRATALGIPYVVWSGAPGLLLGGWWGVAYRIPLRFFIFSNSEAVIAATSMAANHARNLGAKRVLIAHTSFDLSVFFYERAHSGRCLRVLFAGRFVKVKRIPDLLKALKPLDFTTLDMVGEGPLKEGLLKKVEEMGLGARVRLLGARDYGDMPKLYRKYDLLVLPSRWEVFGFVAVEAVMSSLAVVVSSGVGAKDLLHPDVIFPVGNVQALRAKIEEMMDPRFREETVRFAREKVLRLATPQRWSEVFATVLTGG